jgi:hypothetical protein
VRVVFTKMSQLSEEAHHSGRHHQTEQPGRRTADGQR